MQNSSQKDLWFLYLLICSDKTIYTGITNNVVRRIKQHNNGKAAKYTRMRLPVKLAYVQQCKNKSEALKLEHKIKKLSRKNKLELIKNFNEQHGIIQISRVKK